MTISAAWISNRAVFVVADSLRTYSGAAPVPILRRDGTFREPETGADFRSEEAGCKLFDLGDGVVATFAGDAGAAISWLIQIRNHLRYGRTLKETVFNFAAVGAAFSILVGRGERDRPELFLLRSDGTCEEVYENGSPIVLGSLPSDGKDWVKRAIGILPDVTDREQILAAVLMSLQSFGRRVDLRKTLAGGAFFGLCSDGGVVHPQKDILYVVANKNDFLRDGRFETALVCIRGEALVAWPLGGDVAIYVSDVGTASDAEIERQIKESLTPGFQPPFVCLLEKTVGAVVGVDHRKGEPPRLVRLTWNEDASINLTIAGVALDAIRKWPQPSPDLPMNVPYAFFKDP